MKLSRVGSVALVVAIALATVGCSAESEPDPAPVAPTQSDTPTETATPEPTTEPVTCDNIVTDHTKEILESEGFILIEGHEQELRAEGRLEARFFDYGGVDCLWGIAAGGDSMATFGYSEITAANAADVQAGLAANNYLRSEEGTDIIFVIDPEFDVLAHGDVYLFEDGAWYHSNYRESIEEIRQTVAE